MANDIYTYDTSPRRYDCGRYESRKPKNILFRMVGRFLCGFKKIGQALWKHKLLALTCASLFVMVYASHRLTNRWTNIVQTVPEGKMHELCLTDTENPALYSGLEAMIAVGKVTTSIPGLGVSKPDRPSNVSPEEERIAAMVLSPACKR